MNKTEIEHFKRQLLGQKDELLKLEESTKEDSKPVILDQTTVGRLSRMDAIQIQQMAHEVARRRQHELLRIEGAFLRIESGEFGYCSICDEEINTQRLTVDPTITRCMKCAE